MLPITFDGGQSTYLAAIDIDAIGDSLWESESWRSVKYFLGLRSSNAVAFREEVAQIIDTIRDYQSSLAEYKAIMNRRTNAKMAGNLSLFVMLDAPAPPVAAFTRQGALFEVGIRGQRLDRSEPAKSIARRIVEAFCDNDAIDGEFALLEVLGGSMASGRDTRQVAVLEEDSTIDVGITVGEERVHTLPPIEQVIVSRLSGETRYNLVPVYVISTATGKVDLRDAVPLPPRNESDKATRWYVPALSREVTNISVGPGYVAFEQLSDATDYLVEWTKDMRRKIQDAYRWMSKNVESDHEMRDRRMSRG